MIEANQILYLPMAKAILNLLNLLPPTPPPSTHAATQLCALYCPLNLKVVQIKFQYFFPQTNLKCVEKILLISQTTLSFACRFFLQLRRGREGNLPIIVYYVDSPSPSSSSVSSSHFTLSLFYTHHPDWQELVILAVEDQRKHFCETRRK